MKVIISEGKEEADYIVNMYKENRNKVIVINSSLDTCKYLSKKNKIDAIYGNSTKEYDLRVAKIEDADLFISLADNDADNYVACKMAKKIFHVKKCVANVKNPNNVSIFKELGIDSAICSTHLLAETIKNESSVEDVIKSLSLEDDKVSIYEIIIKSEYAVCDKEIKDLDLLKSFNISCIYRNPHVYIPNGNTKLLKDDKVVIVSSTENKKEIIEYMQRKK